jgi:hypothetical protein
MERKITEELLEQYKVSLYEQEKSKATIQKYMCDLGKLVEYAGNNMDSEMGEYIGTKK